MAPRTILITGASGGIGASLATACAAPGVTLLLWGRDQGRLQAAASACEAKGAACRIEAFDLRDMDALTKRLQAADAIDLAIFNAGIGGMPPTDVAAESADASRMTADVNFVSPIVGANVVAEGMAKRGAGQIVLVGSVAGDYPLPQAPTYSATKAGLAMFAEALSIRLKKFNIAVTLVTPGFIDTPMSRSVPEPKPFLMDADTAARIILRGVAARKRRITVPWQYGVIGALVRLVPRPLLRLVLSRT